MTVYLKKALKGRGEFGVGVQGTVVEGQAGGTLKVLFVGPDSKTRTVTVYPDEYQLTAPEAPERVEILPLVLADLTHRIEVVGVKTYGIPLQAEDGRDSLRDAYEEALDLAVYLRKAIEERR